MCICVYAYVYVYVYMYMYIYVYVMAGAQRGDIVESVFIGRLDVEGMLIQSFVFFFVVVVVVCFLNVVSLRGNYRLRQQLILPYMCVTIIWYLIICLFSYATDVA